MRLSCDGKFFSRSGERIFLKGVCYGPFGSQTIHRPSVDFPIICAAGFNFIRVYDLPDEAFLDAAAAADLLVLAGLVWDQNTHFKADPSPLADARAKLQKWLPQHGNHPALGALLVGNEIPSRLTRYLGPAWVRQQLDELICFGRTRAPKLLFAYANFPSTEYLEPSQADFSCLNLFLEEEDQIAAYLPRLHHLAGDRPVLISEFGLDTVRNSEARQADLLKNFLQLSKTNGLAGSTIFTWSDDWFGGGRQMDDWAFGLVRKDGGRKPALMAISDPSPHPHLAQEAPKISIIICTHNGGRTLYGCLASLTRLSSPPHEILLIDDGSTDRTPALAAQFPQVAYHRQDHAGLSTARNRGAELATGSVFAYLDDDCEVDPDYLTHLGGAFRSSSYAAIGGPNLPFPAPTRKQAILNSLPGAPVQVMLTDQEAEHLPGCHLAVRREAFEAIGGFDPQFWTAGDDVDFCWRLQSHGYHLGFCPSSFIWHHRRATFRAYLRQQIGYGTAEGLLYRKSPHRFHDQGVNWSGIVYGGGAVSAQSGDVIYHGTHNSALFQGVTPRQVPPKPLPCQFQGVFARLTARFVTSLGRTLRRRARAKLGGPLGGPLKNRPRPRSLGSREILLWSDRPLSALISALEQDAWLADPSGLFDLRQRDVFLILAEEPGPQKERRVWLRLEGNKKDLREVARGVLKIAKDSGFAPISKP